MSGSDPKGAKETRIEIEGDHYRVVEKPTHTVVYKRYGKGPFREAMIWNSRAEKGSHYYRAGSLAVNGAIAKVLAAIP